MFRSGCRWIAAAGFPIRTSSDLHLYTASRGLSQCPTSFIGVWRQGIHRVPLVTCSRDAEKSNFFSYYFDARSIQLVRCWCDIPVGLSPAGAHFCQHHPVISHYATQPGSLPGCHPSSVCRYNYYWFALNSLFCFKPRAYLLNPGE